MHCAYRGIHVREIRQKWVFVRYESRNGNYANQYSSEQDRLFVP